MEITRTFVQTDVKFERYRLAGDSVEKQEKQFITLPGNVDTKEAASMLTEPETLVKVISCDAYKRTFALDVDEFLGAATLKKEEAIVEKVGEEV